MATEAHRPEAVSEAASPTYAALDCETRATVETAVAAYHLNRKPQTLRIWATYDRGPLRPLRINGRLAWPVAEIRKLVGA